MQTLAAINDDEMAAIYFNITDLSGNRVDDTIDIYDFSVTGVMVHNAQMIHYDETTKTATMLMKLNGGKKLNGKKITVRIDSFLSGAMTKNNYNTGLDLYSLLEKRPHAGYKLINTKTDSISGGGEGFTKVMEQPEVAVLQHDETAISLLGMEWQYISNIGFVDGKLHIQVNPDSNIGRFNHSYFYFTDSNGIRQDIAMHTISHGEYTLDQTTYSSDYIEYVYDISELSQLKDLKLAGEFTTYKNIV